MTRDYLHAKLLSLGFIPEAEGLYAKGLIRLTFRDLVNTTGINAMNLAAIRGGKTKPTKAEWELLCKVLEMPEDEKEAIELLYLGIDKYIQSLNDTLRPGIQE